MRVLSSMRQWLNHRPDRDDQRGPDTGALADPHVPSLAETWRTQFEAATDRGHEFAAAYQALDLSPHQAAEWAEQGIDPALTSDYLRAGYRDVAAVKQDLRQEDDSRAQQIHEDYWERRVQEYHADLDAEQPQAEREEDQARDRSAAVDLEAAPDEDDGDWVETEADAWIANSAGEIDRDRYLDQEERRDLAEMRQTTADADGW